MQQPPAVIIDQAILGGIADSPYMGQKNSLASIVGFNLHKIPGLMLVNQKLSLNSPTIGPNLVDDLGKIVPCSDGNRYLFGKNSGKVWQIAPNDVYTLMSQRINLNAISNYFLPGTAADDAGVGTVAWSSPSSSLVDDTNYASVDTGGSITSHYLKVSNLGFAIPVTATITKIQVEIKRYVDTGAGFTVADKFIQLTKAGAIVGLNEAQAGNWSPTEQYYAYPGGDPLWGTTWTPADINNSGFGVAISVTGTGGIANINAVRIKVYYVDSALYAPIFDAREYYGYLYYAQGYYLGRWKIGSDWTTRQDTYGLFQNGDQNAHPMTDQNLVLYIGDGTVVAQVDASGDPIVPTAFSPQALKVTAMERVTALGKEATNLLVGTKNTAGLNICNVYNWNTWSQSFNKVDPIPENGVNAFMPNKLSVIVSAGENGKFYEYVKSFYGQYIQPLRQVPPGSPTIQATPTLYSPTNTATVFPTAVDTLQAIPIFGFSKVNGNPALQGLYTLGSRDTILPPILTLEYAISTGNLQNITIWSIAVVGNDMYVSWKDETPIAGNPSTVYGVDKLDWNNKATVVYFESRIMKYTRVLMDLFKEFVVNYDQCPIGTSIDFYYSINHQTYVKFTVDEFINDVDRNFWKATQQLQAKTIQFKVAVNSSGNNAANIEDATVLLGE